VFVDAKHDAAVKTLEAAGYTFHGGQLWKPPLGPNPQPLFERIAELEAALDDLLMHCVDGPSADWVMLPRTEFDQVKGRLTPKPKQE
jgi:hypothetical protein